MRYVKVKVKRDVHTVYNRAVPEWEVPVLAFIFEEGNIENLGEFEPVDRDFPEPGMEFDRLTRAYGADPQSGVPFVASVYGQAQAGIRALKQAMDAARLEEEAESKPTTRARGTSRKAAADSLLT